MTRVSKSFGLVVDLATAAAWGFGGYVLASRLLSEQIGGVLGLAIFLSVLALSLDSHLQEVRMERLMAGACPKCRSTVRYEHKHRRWDPARNNWLPASTSWECPKCGFGHGEAWVCPTCPEPD
ncbi:MAG: hypothetical protein GEU75_17630 [Dehalococcoidia bacterium]|nr:hypothetical protein [Dehalococcoidia bacterium]